MEFVVIEGLDGSGKSTQIKMLRSYLELNNVKYQYLHFPRTDSPVYGDLISRFLRGELGENNSINPYLIALIYAGDRANAADMLRKWKEEGYFILADRYVLSNIAYQGAKISLREDQIKLKNWILELEYKYNNIPVPDVNIFLDVPFKFTEKQLTKTRSGEDRNYLLGNRDIHEEDLEFQKRVREIYLSLSAEQNDLKVINCYSSEGIILTPDKIFEKIKKQIFN